MSIWNDEWLVLVHIVDGIAEGHKYYFATKEEAEAFRRSIAMEKDVEACYIIRNPDKED
jgi:hypothetical protein